MGGNDCSGSVKITLNNGEQRIMRMVFPPHATGRFINELTSDMNALVDSFFNDGHESAPRRAASVTPRMDVWESDQCLTLSLDLPGIDPDQLQIELNADAITIGGSRDQASNGPGEFTRRRIERSFGEFRRVVPLPKGVDQEAVQADYTDGVLTVVLPKAVPAEARKVAIQRGCRDGLLATAPETPENPATGE